MSETASTDIIIELSVNDFNKTKEFYSDLGFKVVWEESPNKMNGYLVMRLGNSIICFFCGNDYVYNHPFFKQFSRKTPRGYGIEISIPVKNIDDFFQKIKTKIPAQNIFQPLKEQPWGKKDFRIIDPFGYFLRFNEPWNVLEYLPLQEDYT